MPKRRDDSELSLNPHFLNVESSARNCAKRNGGCEGCESESACKKWWDTLVVDVNSQQSQEYALANAPFPVSQKGGVTF